MYLFIMYAIFIFLLRKSHARKTPLLNPELARYEQTNMNNGNQSPKWTNGQNMLLVVRLLLRLQSRRKRRDPILIINSLLLRNHLRPQRSTNLIHATMLPLIESFQTQGIEDKVVAAVHKVHHLGRWGGGDDVDFGGDLTTV